MLELKLKDINDTEKLAKLLAEIENKKMILTLNGNLAAGKTTLTKFLAKHLGVKDNVNSPTFNILKEYETINGYLYHIDAYRLENSEEDLGFEEIFYEDNICVIEWAEFIDEFLPRERLIISLENINENERKVVIESVGDFYNNIEKEIANRW